MTEMFKSKLGNDKLHVNRFLYDVELKIKKLAVLVLVLTSLCSFAAPASGAILEIRNNVLFGAQGVSVAGTLYNVEFIVDTYSNVYENPHNELLTRSFL